MTRATRGLFSTRIVPARGASGGSDETRAMARNVGARALIVRRGICRHSTWSERNGGRSAAGMSNTLGRRHDVTCVTRHWRGAFGGSVGEVRTGVWQRVLLLTVASAAFAAAIAQIDSAVDVERRGHERSTGTVRLFVTRGACARIVTCGRRSVTTATRLGLFWLLPGR